MKTIAMTTGNVHNVIKSTEDSRQLAVCEALKKKVKNIALICRNALKYVFYAFLSPPPVTIYLTLLLLIRNTVIGKLSQFWLLKLSLTNVRKTWNKIYKPVFSSVHHGVALNPFEFGRVCLFFYSALCLDRILPLL